MMRIIFLLLFLAGAGLAATPWLSDRVMGGSLGTWRVYDEKAGYTPADVVLHPADSPLRVTVNMATIGPAELNNDRPVLILTGVAGGMTVIRSELDFAESRGRDTNPQAGEKVFSQEAGIIEKVEEGVTTFSAEPGGGEGVRMSFVDVVLHRDRRVSDPRLQPAGFAAMAIGFIGLVLSLARRRGGPPPGNPNSQPPPPRWGRAGASDPKA